MAWQHIGLIARRLAASVIEQRRKAAQSAEFEEKDLATVAIPASPVMPSRALAVGGDTGRQLGAQ